MHDIEHYAKVILPRLHECMERREYLKVIETTNITYMQIFDSNRDDMASLVCILASFWHSLIKKASKYIENQHNFGRNSNFFSQKYQEPIIFYDAAACCCQIPSKQSILATGQCDYSQFFSS